MVGQIYCTISIGESLTICNNVLFQITHGQPTSSYNFDSSAFVPLLTTCVTNPVIYELSLFELRFSFWHHTKASLTRDGSLLIALVNTIKQLSAYTHECIHALLNVLTKHKKVYNTTPTTVDQMNCTFIIFHHTFIASAANNRCIIQIYCNDFISLKINVLYIKQTCLVHNPMPL